MRKETKSKTVSFIIGAAIVSLVTTFGTLAFFEADIYEFVRNIVITDAFYIGLYVVWIRLHKNYETMYKSGLKEEK